MDVLSIAVEAAAIFREDYIGYGEATLDIALDGTGASMSSGVTQWHDAAALYVNEEPF